MGMACPICAAPLAPFFRHDRLPALCNALWPTADEARAAAVGDVELAQCQGCGLIVNTAFDPAVFGYSPAYENSLHFSPAFQRFADSVAHRLVERYDLRGRRIAEIGPGSGDFLALLCRLGDNTAIGYDPSHDPDRAPADLDRRVRIVAEPFPVDGQLDVDFVCARHVLEHIPDPVPLVDAIRRSDAPVYLEVPDGGYLLDQIALWDVIYEHCLHFTESAMQTLLTTHGFAPTDGGTAFGDQFLWVEATPSDPAPTAPVDLGPLQAAAARFEQQTAALLSIAEKTLGDLAGPIALWGAGSKGVSFLSMVDAAREVAAVVDINPHKDGLFVPVTAQEVVAPGRLVADPPASVLVLNPNYVDEIGAQLHDLGIDAEVVTLPTPDADG